MTECLICRSPNNRTLLDFGHQPISSHFASAPDTAAVEHNLALAFCPDCGVVQLAHPFPFQDLVPPFSWMTYREPEDHLDAVVEQICALPDLDVNSAIMGISFKDATTLERLRKCGYLNTWSLDIKDDLGAAYPNASIESIQALLTPAKAAEIAGRHGPIDLIIARHILEHAEAPWRLMQALSSLLSPNGYLIIEVPDCTDSLARQDYSMIWEEHVSYFTPGTLPQLLSGTDCVSRAEEVHPFPFENVIVLYAQKSINGEAVLPIAGRPLRKQHAELVHQYAAEFDRWSKRYRAVLTDLCDGGQKLAAYGAGHLTCAFINLHNLADLFAFVVDDTPEKQGLFLPKSQLPIVPRHHLTTQNVSACVFGLTPQLEERIIANNPQFALAGGKFFSMFVDSKRSIRNLGGRSD